MNMVGDPSRGERSSEAKCNARRIRLGERWAHSLRPRKMALFRTNSAQLCCLVSES
jgi:hypothetical protein